MLRLKLELLDDDLVNQIISEGIALLENPGIRVHNQEALEILANAGAKVDFQARIACIPEKITRQALKTTPREFTLFDLKGAPTVHYFGDKIHFDPGSGGNESVCPQTGSVNSSSAIGPKSRRASILWLEKEDCARRDPLSPPEA